MRLYLLLIGLIPVLALGADFYLNQRSQAWEAGLGRTAQLIVGEALGGSPKPLVSTPQQISETAPNVWTLDGNVTRTNAGQSANEAYRIELEQICGEAEDPACWLPRQIVVGGRSIEPRVTATASGDATEQTIDTASLSLESTGASQAAVAIEQTPARVTQIGGQIGGTAETTPPPPPETLAGTPDSRAAGPGEMAAEITPGAGSKPDATATESLSQNVAQQDNAARGQEASSQLAAVDMTVQESLIWLIQDRLNQLGYQDPGAATPNGTLGPGTIFAIKAYQDNYGMPSDGLPSFELLDHLDRNLAQHRSGDGTKIDIAPQAPAQAEVQVAASGDSALQAAPETMQPPERVLDDPTSFDLQKLEQDVMPAAGKVVAPSQEIARAEPRPAAVQQVAALQTQAPEVLPASQQQSAVLSEPTTPLDTTPLDTTPLEQEADESLVFLIQDRLNRLGYDQPRPISLDGKLGPRTRAAIVDYQSRHGLASNGRASRELLDHLEAQLTGRRARATSGQAQ